MTGKFVCVRGSFLPLNLNFNIFYCFDGAEKFNYIVYLKKFTFMQVDIK